MIGRVVGKYQIRGEDLTSFIGRHRIVDPTIAVQIALQLLSALEAAHLSGMVHRDLKPDNILLLPDPGVPGSIRVKILDLGIAKLLGDQRGEPPTPPKHGAILGTPAYLAPEQCRGGAEIDARADLYAIGCILFEMLTGRPPFVAAGGGETMAMHLYESPPRLQELAPGLPLELDTLLGRMLAKHPADRTPSAAWARAALERAPIEPLVAEVPLLGPPSTPPIVTRSAVPREGVPRWIAVLVIAAAAAAAFLIGVSSSSPPRP
ncbi:MAG: serine/threonine protein kinase [Myxococcota bacterium]|nr:serine/threonine protein kinase [Myxococcota bacterium]